MSIETKGARERADAHRVLKGTTDWLGRAILCAAFAGAGIGCGSAQPVVETEEQPVESDEARFQRLVAQGDAAWPERNDEARARESVEAWSAASEIMDDADLLTRLARAHHFLAHGHLQFDPAQQDEMRESYRKGAQTALQALQLLSPDFAQRMAAGHGVEQSLEALPAESVAALYWRSVNIGDESRIDGFATMAAHHDELQASMEWLIEHEREHFYCGPDHFFGSLYASTPTYAGGDLAQSREHFDFAISRFPNYLPTHYSFAVEYAIKQQDRSLFRRELQFILDSDPAALAEVEPENRVAQRQAQIALGRIDEFFGSE